MNERERRAAEKLMNELDDETLARIVLMAARPGDGRRLSGWEQSLDPGASWQRSVRGLLPGTVIAILLALAALVLFIFSPILGIIVGILATLNVIVAVNHWIRLVSR